MCASCGCKCKKGAPVKGCNCMSSTKSSSKATAKKAAAKKAKK